MKTFFEKHLIFWKDRVIRRHVLVSVALFAVGMCLTYLATRYTNHHIGDVASDLLLDNLPVYQVGYIFFQGAFAFVVVVFGILFFEPKYIPFTLEASAIFFTVRSFFMVMTHLAPPSVEYYNYIQHEHHAQEVLFTLSSGNDLFFSGHAGYPFLLALIFWNIKKVRIFFLMCSIVGSIVVILGHLHYSIDVFSAFFIAYGIFEFSKHLFKKEFALLHS
jgi:formate-dependent nitrite reductase membrane component NrfD